MAYVNLIILLEIRVIIDNVNDRLSYILYRRVSFGTFRLFSNVYLGFFFSVLVYRHRGAMSYIVVRALSSYVLSFVSLSAIVSKRSRLS